MKYVDKLEAKDWLALYKVMIPYGEVGDEVRIVKNEELDYVEVTFKEDWTNENGTDLLDTRYRFWDYDPPECLDCSLHDEVKENMKGGFFSYMMDTFGMEYVEDFILKYSNVKIHFPPYMSLKNGESDD